MNSAKCGVFIVCNCFFLLLLRPCSDLEYCRTSASAPGFVLDGTESRDPDGGRLQYAWTCVSPVQVSFLDPPPASFLDFTHLAATGLQQHQQSCHEYLHCRAE